MGTRPEVIKLSPVILALRQTSAVECRVCLTGQHRELVEPLLRGFAVRPDTDLSLMSPGQSLSELTSRLIDALDRYFAREAPDVVLLQGTPPRRSPPRSRLTTTG